MRNVSITEDEITRSLKEAKALNALRATRPNYTPIEAKIYFTDVLVSIDAFDIAERLENPSQYKRWVHESTSVHGFPMVKLYEQCWMVALVGLEVCPVYLGPYMPKEEAQQKADEYNKFLKGE